MSLATIERVVIGASGLIAVIACVYQFVRALQRRDLPAPLQRIEIEWTAVSLAVLLGALAATAL
jgi:hypothetical protein